MSQHEFENRLAVVTGASSGIGLAVVERLLERDARVLAMSRRPGELQALQARFGERLYWQAGDVTQAGDLTALAQTARDLGPVHYLVPNAGIARLADGLDASAFDQQWAINGAGAIETLAALNDELATPSSVVFIGTFLSRVSFPGLAAYIASKAALKAHVRTLAVELAPRGVRLNMVSPGPTATPIWSSLGLGNDELAAVAESVSQRLLGGRFLEPGTVADTILFLLSQAARGLHGQDLVVDSGYTLR
ncbi:SDR family oxidoreductase [Pseudomonas sp. JS3066]|jgi:NAD(P)-dependent dehydrogenase (short-subunit alcohol dehydrogenase family)|uniref:SDR family NAD(P)-dependent oxidoreductase n=1 Tax=unclassified Pseudomonas TaxID=196821 RepID=UPI000EA93E85|nr:MULTISPECIES: SDR family oxidoreductase [unclassified Pseudomonas]AYF89323.1 SDR family oxidoreductase [Pseudomonas sp. DY-1]MDH4655839.1 SDR family oxidoreductase [Pseudomonas sp. BN606]MRK21557.1 SDR family oxidoreductase [Pseudomonas sp. JG-B]WVK93125.1 SDR family oxidoreductase [Pseudomonas sp. JS3066]